MDVYIHGLNGRQAAWALRKYGGHLVLPARPSWKTLRRGGLYDVPMREFLVEYNPGKR
jgi:hypothetical protein